MSIVIPEGERAHIAVLLKAKPELLDALYDALQRAVPSLKHGDLVSWLVSELREIPGANRPALQSIVRSLSSLYQFRIEDCMEPGEIAAEVAEAAQTSADERLQYAEGGWDGFQDRLSKLLSLDGTLGVTARAGYVASQTPRHFHGARVLTDARPIYSIDASSGPSAFVIIHSLELNYYEDGEDRTWFLALDGDDLEALKLAVDRALAKERSLMELLQKTEVPIMSWQDWTDVGD